ncbi:hypothetical protein ABKN59_010944 [Abortiporus biennis]
MSTILLVCYPDPHEGVCHYERINCNIGPLTFIRNLLEIAAKAMNVRIDPKTVKVVKPVNLPIWPARELRTRCQDWVRDHLELLEDDNIDRRIDPLHFAITHFPEGHPVDNNVDLLIISDEFIESIDTLGELRFTTKQLLNFSSRESSKRAYIAPSPSEGVKSVEGIQKALVGLNAIVHEGRPVGNYGLPPALFNSALAKFDNHLRHWEQFDDLIPDNSLLANTHLFISQSLAIYDNEQKREDTLTLVMMTILGEEAIRQARYEGGANLDMVWAVDGATRVISEFKNEYGLQGDAFLQGSLSLSRVVQTCKSKQSIPRNTNFPTIIIAVMGNHIEIGSAVSLGDGIYSQRLFSQRLELGFHAHDHVLRLATSLVPRQGSPEQEVLVKFTARYNPRAHKLLEEAGFAPKLHSCSRVCGELYMVVMDYLDGKTMWQYSKQDIPIPQSVYDDVEKAIKILHKEEIVFGDLRSGNIMCVESQSQDATTEIHAKLIDFDWAGVHGKDR